LPTKRLRSRELESIADTRSHATSVPEPAANCGHQQSPTGTTNGLRPGHVQVDPPARNDLL